MKSLQLLHLLTLSSYSFAQDLKEELHNQTSEFHVNLSYLEARINMFNVLMTWTVSVILGYVFGNFASASWSLDFAIPLGFVALLLPSLKDNDYVVVADFRAFVSLAFVNLPLKIGIIVTALLSTLLAWWVVRRERRA